MAEGAIEIDGSEPIEAIDRTTRAIIMAIDAAVNSLEAMGYERDTDIRIIDSETSFPGVVLGSRYVFGVVTKVSGGRIVIDGEWLLPVRPLGRFRRWWRARRRARAT
jgi:hypothetical protein